jgi:hypothetical protein
MRKLQGSGGNWAARSAAGLLRNSGHATELMRGGIIPIILSSRWARWMRRTQIRRVQRLNGKAPAIG